MEEGCAMRDHHRLKWVGVISWKTGGRGFSGQAEKAGGGVVEVVSLSVTAQSRCPKQEPTELALETHGCPNTGQVGHLDLTWNDALVLERTTIQI